MLHILIFGCLVGFAGVVVYCLVNLNPKFEALELKDKIHRAKIEDLEDSLHEFRDRLQTVLSNLNRLKEVIEEGRKNKERSNKKAYKNDKK